MRYNATMSTPSERAKNRRLHWVGGVAQSHKEADEMDITFWMNASYSERIRGVTQLMREMWLASEDHGPTARLQRAVGGVRPRGG